MNKFALLFFFLLCTALAASAQKTVATLFLKDNDEYVNHRDSADYIRIIQKTESPAALFMVTDFYKDGQKRSVGSSLRVFPTQYEGQYISYFKNGKRKQIATYHEGSLTDTIYNFYPNGELYNVMVNRPVPKRADLLIAEPEYYIVTVKDSLGKDLVVNGNGECMLYNEDFNYINESGSIRNGLHDGIWTGELKDVRLKYTETYEEGKLISGKSIDDDGTVRIYATANMLAGFKGGTDKFFRTVGKKIRYPMSAVRNKAQGLVPITFTIKEDGTLADFLVIGDADKELAAEVIIAFKTSPLWEPAVKKGKKVKTKFALPMMFILSN